LQDAQLPQQANLGEPWGTRAFESNNNLGGGAGGEGSPQLGVNRSLAKRSAGLEPHQKEGGEKSFFHVVVENKESGWLEIVAEPFLRKAAPSHAGTQGFRFGVGGIFTNAFDALDLSFHYNFFKESPLFSIKTLFLIET
jgi:hypothetical protein